MKMLSFSYPSKAALVVVLLLMINAADASTAPIIPFDETGNLLMLDNTCGLVRINVFTKQVSVDKNASTLALIINGKTSGPAATFGKSNMIYDKDGNLLFVEETSDAILKYQYGNLFILVTLGEICYRLGITYDPVNAIIAGISFTGNNGLIYALIDTGTANSDCLVSIDPYTKDVKMIISQSQWNIVNGGLPVEWIGAGIMGNEDGELYLMSSTTLYKVITSTRAVSIKHRRLVNSKLSWHVTRDPVGNMVFVNEEDYEIDKFVSPSNEGPVSESNLLARLNTVYQASIVECTGVIDPAIEGLAFGDTGELYFTESKSQSLYRFDADLLECTLLLTANDIKTKLGLAPSFTTAIAFEPVHINECSSSPCQNGGTCLDSLRSYTCNCSETSYGTNCEFDKNDCTSAPCQNGGTCSDLVGGFSCTCPTGVTGASCDQDVNECLSSPCQKGFCNNFLFGYNCTCGVGYTGALCSVNINDCESAPCQNGGSCTDLVAGYSCTCPPGFLGTNCETVVDDCNPNPCQNSGNCTNIVLGNFTCSCPTGFEGNVCQTNINDCSSNNCENGATCVDGINSFSCTCLSGFNGTTCGQDIDECLDTTICQNGGSCLNLPGTYSCQCATGFTGANCETVNTDPCASSPCSNGGTCTAISTTNFTCACELGFYGSTCSDFWTEFQGSFYRYDPILRTWNEGESTCVMASIHSQQEFDFVKSLGPTDGQGYWLGGRREDPALLTTFSWDDGTSWDFELWLRGEPNNKKDREHCVRMNVNGWKDAICSTPRPIVCKRPVTGTISLVSRRRRRRRAV